MLLFAAVRLVFIYLAEPLVFFSALALNAAKPYEDDSTDALAQMCQVQIFFALASSVPLRVVKDQGAESGLLDIALTVLMFMPMGIERISLSSAMPRV